MVAESPSVVSLLMAAAASASVPVPPTVTVPLTAPLLSFSSMLDAPYAEVVLVQAEFWFTTECAAARVLTVKVSEPAGGLVPVAEAATLPEVLVALADVQRLGSASASAAARTAANVVFTVW